MKRSKPISMKKLDKWVYEFCEARYGKNPEVSFSTDKLDDSSVLFAYLHYIKKHRND